MKRTSLVCLIGGLIFITGCQSSDRSSQTSRLQEPRRAVSNFQQRAAYVEQNYELQLKTGRAKNEKEARALSALEWEHVRNRADNQTQQSITWSSRDAALRKQEKLRSDLEKMEME